MNASPAALPFWAEVVISVLLLAGAFIALIGSFGLVRLRTFFERVHAPAIIATMGCWCIMHATVLYFTLRDGTLAAHFWLIALFLAATVPITTIFLMRAGLFRARQMGDANIPISLSRILPAPMPVYHRDEIDDQGEFIDPPHKGRAL